MALNIFLMVVALSVDIFISCAAYGARGDIFSARQIAVMNGICSLCLGVSLMFGSVIDSFVPEKFTKEICFFSLLVLGCIKLADSGICRFVRNHKGICRNFGFVFSKLNFIITIYSNPIEADVDKNCNLSWKELVFLSLAMSIDCLITGAMAAFMKLPVWITVVSLFLIGELSAYFGFWLGEKISLHCPKDISWISGVIFIILSVTKR